ncbi:hypothetical protein ACTXT7_012880 [Hymenolepis weldensis]
MGVDNKESQFSRGGGTLCVMNPRIWKLFRDIVVQVEGCPISIPWKVYEETLTSLRGAEALENKTALHPTIFSFNLLEHFLV